MTIFVNDRKVGFKRYPNGELIVPKITFPTGKFHADVRLQWTGDEDLIQLVMVKSALPPRAVADLYIDYMPYSRMDRDQGEMAFTLRAIADQIVSMGWDQILVVEPHSDVTLNLLRAKPIWATMNLLRKTMQMIGFDKQRDWVVLPDKGAHLRYSAQDPIMADLDLVVLSKTREFETGKITGLEISERIMRGTPPEEEFDSRALIIDDLSSRGGTFVAAAELMRKRLDVTEVSLLVTHMEPVGLLGDLRTKLNRVFCTDTMDFPRPVPSNFHVFHREDYL